MFDQKAYIRKWQKENRKQFNLRFSNCKGILDALRKMQDRTGENPTQYMRRVVLEKLKEDGYL